MNMGEIPRPDHDVLSESIFLAAAKDNKAVGVGTGVGMKEVMTGEHVHKKIKMESESQSAVKPVDS